ncbi:hypothetical protein BO82DRAFT_437218 [Aspergillus uvarum CBS 121591]|uniref:FAD-binding domain-containing protein n=1 Tax=Aspergillus uvarum CBS 121591 TaxID=1448315 RepID=A0A319D6U9_9EURO|nr:hypothetical protein BO82DRAFT_437218 [Aspergillus uvarum CBS 121591]PYH75702.1 hypothetical protein BO82DRAFT_437218 [Aspergillus uvarum CBS 121591]
MALDELSKLGMRGVGPEYSTPILRVSDVAVLERALHPVYVLFAMNSPARVHQQRGKNWYGLLCVIPAKPEKTQQLKWAAPADETWKAKLLSYLGDWNSVMTKIIRYSTKLGVFPAARGTWPRSMVDGDRLVFLGDTGHPTGGALSAGSALAYEDAKSLYLTLGHAHRAFNGRWTPESIKLALESYDEMRIPHLKKIWEEIKVFDTSMEAVDKHAASDYVSRDIRWVTNNDVDADLASCIKAKELRGLNNASLEGGGSHL